MYNYRSSPSDLKVSSENLDVLDYKQASIGIHNRYFIFHRSDTANETNHKLEKSIRLDTKIH